MDLSDCYTRLIQRGLDIYKETLYNIFLNLVFQKKKKKQPVKGRKKKSKSTNK